MPKTSPTPTRSATARDLAAPKFEEPSQLSPTSVANISLTRTADNHLGSLPGSGSPFRSERDNYEVRPIGNAVSLEDEMMKVAANQMDYQAATETYTQSINLIKTALGKR